MISLGKVRSIGFLKTVWVPKFMAFESRTFWKSGVPRHFLHGFSPRMKPERFQSTLQLGYNSTFEVRCMGIIK
jgi:hypothetical protein